jgi:hypothetical protein
VESHLRTLYPKHALVDRSGTRHLTQRRASLRRATNGSLSPSAGDSQDLKGEYVSDPNNACDTRYEAVRRLRCLLGSHIAGRYTKNIPLWDDVGQAI